ncbi:MAG TPA: hypothetical protein ENN76_01275 [Euryarchaeota archaeon]|nr:hypothetical protein [Euryarchaeota archaeon]
MFFLSFKVGLALGAGGAKGYSHVAVIEKLLENGITFNEVSGSSAGAAVGAYYCLTGDVRKIVDVTKNMTTREFQRVLQPNLPTQSIFQGAPFEKFLRKHFLKDSTFADLTIPFKVCAVDIINQEVVYIEDGDLAKAVMASSSIPGLVPPYEHMGRLFVDGGVMEPVPTKVLLRCGCQKVIAVNLNKYVYATKREMNVRDILTESYGLMMRSMAEKGMEDPNVFEIAPKFYNAPSYHLNFSEVDFNYNAGLCVMEKEMDNILTWLKT